MRVVQVEEHGGPEVLSVRDVDPPRLQEGHVRVQVAAAGVNFIDIHERSGAYPRALPFVPGGEGSGRVIEVAPGLEHVAIGQRVAWQAVAASYAEEVVVPAGQLISIPDQVDDFDAAALPVQGLTAHYLATSAYEIQRGDTVVVHAGAGGLGLVLTQVATALGARVITTVSTPEKAEISRAAGAQVATGYEDLGHVVREATSGAGAAAVYDSVGRNTFESSLRSLRRRGTLVLCGRSSGPVPPFELERLGQAGSLLVTRPTLRDYVSTRSELVWRSDQLLQWLGDGRVRLRLGTPYSLSEAAAAHEALESRRTTGKLLLP